MIRPALLLGVFGALVFGGLACTPLELARPLVLVPDPPAAPGAPLEVAWERNVEGALGPGAPLVTKDYLTMGTRRGDIALVSLRDGQFEGASSFGRSVEGGLTLAPDGRRVYIPLASGRRGLLAHDLVSGRRAWQAELGPVVTTPALIGTTVVAASLDGTVAGLETSTGETLWSLRPDTTASFRASPVPVDGAVVVADDRGVLRQLEVRTGQVGWRQEVEAPVYASMASQSGLVMVPTTRGSLVALAAESGEVLWRMVLGEGARVGAPAFVGDHVIVGTSEGLVVALHARSGRERWRAQVEGVVRARPAVGEGVVYIGTMAKRLVALDVETGDTVWETTLRGRVKTDLTVAGSLLIVATEPRHIVALRTARSAS